MVAEWSHHWPENTLVVSWMVPRIGGRWHHLCITYDGTSSADGVTVFVDGQPVSMKVESNSLSNTIATSTPLRIGLRDTKFWFQGALDDLRFYAQRLSNVEVSQLYRLELCSLIDQQSTNRNRAQRQLLSDARRRQLQQPLQLQLLKTRSRISEIGWHEMSQWRVNGIRLTLLRIPVGQVPGENASIIEMPHDFFLGDREITVGQFQQFIDDPDYPAAEKPKDWRGVNTSVSPTPDHPAQQVSWYDAVLYCNWLSHREGLTLRYVRTGEKDKDNSGKETEYDAWRLDAKANGYRLPTEAEWEYACRAGTTTEFSIGNSEAILRGYCQKQSSRSAICGSKLPNGWGLFDVHGNVWEWCEDSEGSRRVFRGGGWVHDAAYCRSASRFTNVPTVRSDDYGFRLALSSPSDQSPEVEPVLRAEPVGVGTEGVAEQRP